MERTRALWRNEGGALLFVWAVWLVQLCCLLGFVHAFAVDVPRFDDWEMVPVISGAQPVTLSWLWSQHNEHRIVLPRLLFLLVTKLSGDDFRACIYFDVALLGACTAALLVCARTLRGQSSIADAFFPLVLMHLGQADTLIWAFQIQFVGGSALVLGSLCALARSEPLRERAALWLGLCAVLLPLFGGNGLALAPALASCALSLAWQLRKQRPQGRTWAIVAALGVASFALMAVYFIGYQRPPAHGTSPSLAATLTAVGQVLSYALGSGIRSAMPTYQYLVPSLVALTLLALLHRLITVRRARLSTLRFGSIIVGMLVLVGAIAWARAAVYPGGVYASRYVPLLGPLMCGLYLAWSLVPSQQAARCAQATLFLVVALLALRNRSSGIVEAIGSRDARDAAVADITRGMPLSQVASQHCGALYVCQQQPLLLARMRMLQAHKIGVFAKANPR